MGRRTDFSNLVWKYTNMQHTYRIAIGINAIEYTVVDLVYKCQSHPASTIDGWTDVSHREIGDFLGMAKSTVQGVVERMAKLGLIEFADEKKKLKRTTEDWYLNAYVDDQKAIRCSVEKIQRIKAQIAERSKSDRSPNGRNPIDSGRNPIDERSKSDRPTLVLIKNGKEVKEVAESDDPATPGSDKKPNGKRPSAKPPGKAKKQKWSDGAFMLARSKFDESYRQWQRNKGLEVSDQETLYWDPKEIGQLSLLMNRLKFKAENSGQNYPDDKVFVSKALGTFLDVVPRLESWFLDKYTPTHFVTHFENLYIDVKRHISNGYTGKKGKPSQADQVKAGRQNTIAAIEQLEAEGYFDE